MGSTRLTALLLLAIGPFAVALPAAAQSTAPTAAPSASPSTEAAVVSAQPVAAGSLLTANNPGRIAAYLRQIGYRPELTTDLTGDPRIVIGLAGVPGSLWFNDCDEDGTNCESVRLQVGLLTDRKLTLDQVNAFNNQWRFATLSLDEDQDPLLNEDLWLDGPGMPAALLARNVRQFEALVKELRDLVNAHEEAGAQ